MPLNYTDLETEILAILNQQKLWVLATASQNRVTARTVSVVNRGLTLYFQTGNNSDKALQILENPNVALCFSNVQIEGIARILGHPLEPANRDFAVVYQQFHPASFAKYTHLNCEILVEIKPTMIALWKYLNAGPCRDLLDIQTQTATRVVYESTH